MCNIDEAYLMKYMIMYSCSTAAVHSTECKHEPQVYLTICFSWNSKSKKFFLELVLIRILNLQNAEGFKIHVCPMDIVHQ